MSTLSFIWDNITPLPDCGYTVEYRRVGEQVSYSELVTSGSTSGTTAISVEIDAPANYEGAVYSQCCSGSTSEGDPYAVNAYSLLSVNIITSDDPSWHFVTQLSALFPNPYDNVVSGSFTASGISHSIDFEATLAAGTTSGNTTVVTGDIPTSGTTITGITITSIDPVFDNGGSLQQFDPVSSPSYFKFYNGSIPETSGSPIAQPSFLLTAFVVTEVDSSNNPTAGNLLITWGQEVAYANAVTPYDNFTFYVRDENSDLLGQLTVSAATKGLRTASIPIVKASIPLDTAHQYSMRVLWDNGATVGSNMAFYLPDF